MLDLPRSDREFVRLREVGDPRRLIALQIESIARRDAFMRYFELLATVMVVLLLVEANATLGSLFDRVATLAMRGSVVQIVPLALAFAGVLVTVVSWSLTRRGALRTELDLLRLRLDIDGEAPDEARH